MRDAMSSPPKQMEKPRILMLLASGHFPNTRVEKQAMSLSKNGFSVELLALDRSGKRPTREKRKWYSVNWIQNRLESYAGMKALLPLLAFNARAIIKSRFLQFDIIVAHEFDTLIAATLISLLSGKKLVYDAHESYTDVKRANHIPEPIVTSIGFLEQMCTRQASLVTTVCEPIRKRLAKTNHNTRTILNAQVLSDYEAPASIIHNLREKLLPRGKKVIVAYLGTMNRRRNLGMLINACANLPGIQLVMAGSGEQQLTDELQQACAKNNFVFLGQVEHEQVSQHTAAADVLFAAFDPANKNYALAMPNKLFDAIAAKKPIIATKNTEYGNFVEQWGIGITIKPNQQELETAIRFCTDKKNALKMKENATKIRGQYSWETEEKKLVAAYHGLVNTRKQ